MGGTEREGAAPCGRRAGVYSLTCRSTGRTYVGCSDHLAAEIEAHRTRLADGRHPNEALQADYDAHGRGAFDVAVLDELGPAECGADLRRHLDELRDLWVDQLGVDEGRSY